MTGFQKFLIAFFGTVTVLALSVVFAGFFFPAEVVNAIRPGSTFSWENFDPLSRGDGWLGMSPLIWTSLLVLPTAVLLPLGVYFFEKKSVGKPLRLMLTFTRTSALLLLYLLIAGPAVQDAETWNESSQVAVLVDDSLSMGGEVREFPIFNVMDDRESDSVQQLLAKLNEQGIRVETPPRKGFVTLTDDELTVRNFVRDLVLERVTRLKDRLAEMHGGAFDIAEWQIKRAEVQRLSHEADLKQSEIASERGKEKPDKNALRLLQSDLDALLNRIRVVDDEFSTMLGGDTADEKVRKKRALIDNLLETVQPEGPRRWDIACEMVAPGNKILVTEGNDMSLLDMIEQRAIELASQRPNQEPTPEGEQPETNVRSVRVFVFSTQYGRDELTNEAILEVKRDELDFRAPMGRLTEFDRALQEVRRYYSGDDNLSTILVLSDGRDTSPDDNALDEAPTRGVEGTGPVVVSLGIGNPKPVKVLELLSVNADREVLKGDYVDFKLKIRADKAWRADPKTGKPGTRVKIILCEDSLSNPVEYEEINGAAVRTPADTEIELGPEELAEVKIRFKPETPGKHVYYLKVNEDRLPDEDTYRNNVKEHYLEVIDRKIKVLYLEQRFRWEARYLNQALKRDKKLEYQAYFFDAQEGWTQPTSNYDEEVKKTVKPLRSPFYDAKKGAVVRNKDDFFKLNYDVIIIGDVDPQESFRLQYWDWIEEWVSRHRGGLILLSGMRHNPSGYTNIEKARMLYPVELDLPSPYEPPDVTRMKYWRLTPAGRAHEIHRMSTNSERNDELWGRVKDGTYVPGELNGFYWYQKTGGIKPAPAQVLSRVTRSGKVTGDGDVLSAVMPYGNGMTLYFGSDESFRMRQYVGDYWFYRLWQNSIRFVASRRLAGKQQRVDVYTDKTKYQVSEDVKIYVELLGDIYGEVVQNQNKELNELPKDPDNPDVRRMIVNVQGRSGGVLTTKRVILREVSWSPNLFEGVVEANEPGMFDVWVKDYEESRKSPHRYQVIAPVAELRNLTMDFDGLLTRSSKLPPGAPALEYQQGKRVWQMADVDQTKLEVREKENILSGITNLVWNTEDDKFGLRSLLLILLLLILAGEWLSRKTQRMV